jgi:hypothetical protein
VIERTNVIRLPAIAFKIVELAEKGQYSAQKNNMRPGMERLLYMLPGF